MKYEELVKTTMKELLIDIKKSSLLPLEKKYIEQKIQVIIDNTPEPSKTLEDAVRYITAIVSSKYGEDFGELTGNDMKAISGLRAGRVPKWLKPMRTEALNEVFEITKDGNKTKYKRR